MERQPRNGLLLEHETGGSYSEPPRICGAPSHHPSAARAALAAALLAAVCVAALAGPSFGAVEPRDDAAVQPRGGKYNGKTSQASVEPAFRKIAFRVKGRRITLTI